MNCEQISALLPDYWQGSLSAEQQRTVETHLAGCNDCREAATLWTRLGELPTEQPSAQLRVRFESMLEAYQHGLSQRPAAPASTFSWADLFRSLWPRTPSLQFAMCTGFLAAGVLIGHFATASSSQSKELAQLHQEVAGMREMVAVSLLQQQSATDRLRGVSWSHRLARPDNEVLSALISAVKHDPSVDVRLAAADALRKYSQEPDVRRGLVDALNEGQSPLVQIALIEELTDLKEPSTVHVLRQLENDRNVNEAVRQRASWALEQF